MGDHLRLVCPASFPENPGAIDESAGVLSSWGLQVEIGEHALDRRGYMAGRDQDRLADLNAAYTDPHGVPVTNRRNGPAPGEG
ncbi:LD-carboxypeptidase [Nocardia tengchongensis]|uniref:LD-carboxypeptidase n=1 Tax=Nocardia tengchongensis TaxID=2055889 RepID=UPI003623D933